MIKKFLKTVLTGLLFLTFTFSYYYPNYANTFSRLLDLKLQKVENKRQYLKNLYIKLIKLKKQIARRYHSSKTYFQKQKYKNLYRILLDWQKVIKEKYERVKKYSSSNLNSPQFDIPSKDYNDTLTKQKVDEILLNLQKNIFKNIGLNKLNEVIKKSQQKEGMLIDGVLEGKVKIGSFLNSLKKFSVSGKVNLNNVYYLKDGLKEQVKGRFYGDGNISNSGFYYDITADLITSGGKSAIKITNFVYNGFVFNNKLLNYVKALNDLSKKYGYLQLGMEKQSNYLLKKLKINNLFSQLFNRNLFKVYKKEGDKFVLMPGKLLCDISYIRRGGCSDWQYQKFVEDFTGDLKKGKCKIYFYSIGNSKYKIDIKCKNYKGEKEPKQFYFIINGKGEILQFRLYDKSADEGWVNIDYQKDKKLFVDIYIFRKYRSFDEIKELPLMKVKIKSNGLQYSGTFYRLKSLWYKKELVGTVRGKLGANLSILGTYGKPDDNLNKIKFDFYFSPVYSILKFKKSGLEQYDIYTYLSDNKYVLSGNFFVGGFDIKGKLVYYPNKFYIDGYIYGKYGTMSLISVIANGKIKRLENNFNITGYVYLPKYFDYRYGISNKVQFSYYIKDNKVNFGRVYEDSRLKVFSSGLIDIDVRFKGNITKIKNFIINYPTKVKIISYIQGISMLPTIYDGDVVINKKPENLKRGDIISFYPPVTSYLFLGSKVPYIKRLIGLPGEEIMIDEKGKLYICKNGNCKSSKSYGLDLGYVSPLCGIGDFKLTTGYFVMGDDVEFSTDSRCAFRGYYYSSFYKSYLLNTGYYYRYVDRFFKNAQVSKSSIISKTSYIYHTSNFIKFNKDGLLDIWSNKYFKNIVYSLAKRYILSEGVDNIKSQIENNGFVKIPSFIGKTKLERFLLNNVDFYIYKTESSPYFKTNRYFYVIGVRKGKKISKLLFSSLSNYSLYVKVVISTKNVVNIDDFITTGFDGKIRLRFGFSPDMMFKKIVIENKTNGRKIICDEYNMKYVCSNLSLSFSKEDLKNNDIVIHFIKWNGEEIFKRIR